MNKDVISLATESIKHRINLSNLLFFVQFIPFIWTIVQIKFDVVHTIGSDISIKSLKRKT